MSEDLSSHTGTSCVPSHESQLQQAQQRQTVQQQEQQQPAALQVRHCQLHKADQQHQSTAGDLVTQTQSEFLPSSRGEQQASTSDVSDDLGNFTVKASSFQETFRGFAVGSIIPKGTPVVLVAELKPSSAPTAVGYANTLLDMVRCTCWYELHDCMLHFASNMTLTCSAVDVA